MKKTRDTPDPPNLLKYQDFTFKIIRKIGEGGFARCYEAEEERSGRRFAIKAIHSKEIVRLKAKNKLLNEVEIHHQLDNRHIVKLYRIFNDENFVYLVLELCENRTLSDLLKAKKAVSESETRQYLWMILCGIEYLHGKNIIHRDLKLGNLFLNLENEVKLGDFGLATTLKQIGDRKKTMCGTPNYIAPEVLFDKERGHGFEVDIWSIGIIMYILLFGKAPFQGPDVKDIYRNIRKLSYAFPPSPDVSAEAKNLIQLLLTPDPDKRPKLHTVFTHEFFKYVVIKNPTPTEVVRIQTYCIQLCSEPSPNPEKTTKEKRKSTVETIYETLCHHLDANARYASQRSEICDEASTFYIEKWLDYTTRYGIGYLCSNGKIGAYFNDSTSMVLCPKTKTIEYQKPEIQNTSKLLVRINYKLDNYPTDLNKKVLIINQFCTILLKNSRRLDYDDTTFFVLKFAILNDMVVFRLSTKAVQVIFSSDQYSILLSSYGNLVTTINPQQNIPQSIPIWDIQQSTVLFKKLRIFKNTLASLLSTGTKNSN